MEIYQHYRKDEHPFIDQVLSWIEEVERTFSRKLTDFLDPRQQQIVTRIIASTNDELQVRLLGGGEHSERKRAIIAPYYEIIEENDFQLTLVQATYHTKFITLTHRDVMGAFLSLGIKRKKLGDIFVQDGLVQLIMAQEISTYVLTHLSTIKHAKLSFHEQPFSKLVEREPNWVLTDSTVSSLRLDNLVKDIYNLSRNEASELIKKKLVKVNYRIVEDSKFIVEENDVLSLRGKGRSKLVKMNGRTKKDKIRITTARLVD